ncbi:MAG: hypothetical protein ACOZQL_31075 [Myxococcota bacterium]
MSAFAPSVPARVDERPAAVEAPDPQQLVRLEAMLIALRDQLDHLAERVDARLADQQLALNRLRLDVARFDTARAR